MPNSKPKKGSGNQGKKVLTDQDRDEMGYPVSRKQKQDYEKTMNEYLEDTRKPMILTKVPTSRPKSPGNVPDNTRVSKPKPIDPLRLNKNIPKAKSGGTASKKFASLAPPYNKATFADKIAGAKGVKPKMKTGGSCGTPKRLGRGK